MKNTFCYFVKKKCSKIWCPFKCHRSWPGPSTWLHLYSLRLESLDQYSSTYNGVNVHAFIILMDKVRE